MNHTREACVDGTQFGRYRLVELLGRRGMGEVWRAFDTAIDRRYRCPCGVESLTSRQAAILVCVNQTTTSQD